MPFDAASYIAGKNAGGGGGSSVTVEPLTVTENGTHTAPDGKAFTPVTVNVPNSYSASDEGKVVSNGSLVAQSSDTVNQNGTVDTTLINSLTVNVPTGGGGGVPSNDVNFIDYDGTIVYSYSAADFADLTELPDNPSHSGLTAQGWNWTLADAKTYVASYGFLDIGQMYVTSDGKTRVYIHLDRLRKTAKIGVRSKASSAPGTATVDFGDGSSPQTLTLNSMNTNVFTDMHEWPDGGDYVITIDSSVPIAIPVDNAGQRLLVGPTTSTYDMRYYSSCVKKVELGTDITFGQNSFAYMESLQSITIPANYVSVFGSQNAFAYCISLRSITIPPTATQSGSSLFSGSRLKYVCIPKTMTGIDKNMFKDVASQLQRIFLPSGITAIPESFAQNAYCLLAVVVPATVTSMAANAFATCKGIATLKFMGETPPTLAASSSIGIATTSIVLAPYAGLASYLSATNYPSSATYTYLGFATYASGATLPTQDTTQAYNVTWYATKEDAIAGTNPITQGNGSEVYCTYAAV